MDLIEQIRTTVDWAMRKKYNRTLASMEPVPDEEGWWDDKGANRTVMAGGCGGCSPKSPGRYKYLDPGPGDPYRSWKILLRDFQNQPRNPNPPTGTF